VGVAKLELVGLGVFVDGRGFALCVCERASARAYFFPFSVFLGLCTCARACISSYACVRADECEGVGMWMKALAPHPSGSRQLNSHSPNDDRHGEVSPASARPLLELQELGVRIADDGAARPIGDAVRVLLRQSVFRGLLR
jgi:hypothetical protein